MEFCYDDGITRSIMVDCRNSGSDIFHLVEHKMSERKNEEEANSDLEVEKNAEEEKENMETKRKRKLVKRKRKLVRKKEKLVLLKV